ncbi:hypothetical protein J8273_8587 [Carpediemonas membranifera]|uniref:Uncharacterized protein n=1 Tax=Carpediemonas membranifera TaxID=201153 RepID=A0A8J6AQZ9_9EUKA|nr:hypothetical protein J8273_8587 [Carpediemonas membranifera]|eukprot:KAG9389900.1 hypothetical protein J8273_8587 [Carpediemonas membranifera]
MPLEASYKPERYAKAFSLGPYLISDEPSEWSRFRGADPFSQHSRRRPPRCHRCTAVTDPICMLSLSILPEDIANSLRQLVSPDVNPDEPLFFSFTACLHCAQNDSSWAVWESLQPASNFIRVEPSSRVVTAVTLPIRSFPISSVFHIPKNRPFRSLADSSSPSLAPDSSNPAPPRESEPAVSSGMSFSVIHISEPLPPCPLCRTQMNQCVLRVARTSMLHLSVLPEGRMTLVKCPHHAAFGMIVEKIGGVEDFF